MKSIIVAIIEKLPKILLATSLLICVIRAQPGDLPKIVQNLTNSNVFGIIGWVVAVVETVIAVAAVLIYVKLIKPKK